MSHGARSVHSSHASRKANASSDEEVDELATPPASQIPDVEDSSDEEQDTGYRRYTRHRRALTADEKVLAKIVRNGVDAEQLKLIKGITILLRTHKAKTLEAQGLRDLDEYVVKAIMADPSRKPLRQVKETLCTWTRNRGLPVVPISATTVFLYAHNIFVGQKAVWKHELRMSLLNVLAELRSVANKAYENDFRGMIQYRKAFLDSILDTPEARALATVERDLDTDSDSSSDSAREDKAVSSGEEVAQKLTASSPGDTKRKDSAVDNPTPSSPDSGRPVFKRRRRNSKALPIHPTDPSEWTNARMLNPKMLNSDHSIALKTDISRQPAQRIVIDLSLDTSDEEELPTPAVATAHQAVPVERSSNSRASQQVDIASQSGEDTQATVQRQPRPPLIPRPRTEGVRPSTRPAAVQSPPAPEPSSSTDANNVSFPTVNKANENPSSGAASGPDDPLNTRQSAAVFFNKAVRAVKEKLAGNVLPACSDPPNPGSESSLPAQPQSEAIHDGASKTCTLGSASVELGRQREASTKGSLEKAQTQQGAATAEAPQDNTPKMIDLTQPAEAISAAVDESSGPSDSGTVKATPDARHTPPETWPTRPAVNGHAPAQDATVRGTNPTPTVPPSAPGVLASRHLPPNHAPPIYDQWDLSFFHLEQAVFKALGKLDSTEASRSVATSEYIKETTPNKQASALFGWQRNARRSERLHSAHLPSNTNQRSPDTPNSAGASLPARQISLVQWHNMSPEQHQMVRYASMQRLKPRYPDFLRNIRTPTVATGLGPVYLGSTSRAQLMGTSQGHRRPSVPSPTAAAPTPAPADSIIQRVDAAGTIAQRTNDSTNNEVTAAGSSDATIALQEQSDSQLYGSRQPLPDLGLLKAMPLPTRQAGTEHAALNAIADHRSIQTGLGQSRGSAPSVTVDSDQAHRSLPITEANRFTEVTSPVTKVIDLTATSTSESAQESMSPTVKAGPVVQSATVLDEAHDSVRNPSAPGVRQSETVQTSASQSGDTIAQRASTYLGTSLSNGQRSVHQAMSNPSSTSLQIQDQSTFRAADSSRLGHSVGRSLPSSVKVPESGRRSSDSLPINRPSGQRRSSQPSSMPQTSPPLVQQHQSYNHWLNPKSAGQYQPTDSRRLSYAVETPAALQLNTSPVSSSGINMSGTNIGQSTLSQVQQTLPQHHVPPQNQTYVQRSQHITWQPSVAVSSRSQISSPYGSPQHQMQSSFTNRPVVYIPPSGAWQQATHDVSQRQLQSVPQTAHQHTQPYLQTQQPVYFQVQQRQQQPMSYYTAEPSGNQVPSILAESNNVSVPLQNQYLTAWPAQQTFQPHISAQSTMSSYHYGHPQSLFPYAVANQAHVNANGLMVNNGSWPYATGVTSAVEQAQAQELYARQILTPTQGASQAVPVQQQGQSLQSTSSQLHGNPAGVAQIEPIMEGSSTLVQNGHPKESNNSNNCNDVSSLILLDNETQTIASSSSSNSLTVRNGEQQQQQQEEEKAKIAEALDRMIATSEILEQQAKLAAEKESLNYIFEQSIILKKAGVSESDVDYFKKRALFLMNESQKEKLNKKKQEKEKEEKEKAKATEQEVREREELER